MSDPEAPLITAGSQTDVNAESPTQRARSSRSYKVAGLTLLACVLIVGQATITYFLFSQRNDISSLQEQNNKMKAQLNEARVYVPIKGTSEMPIKSLPGALDEEFSSGTPARRPLTVCQQEAAGLKPMQVPGKPVCDEFGLYRPSQCYMDICWCVNPTTGEQVTPPRHGGADNCSSTGSHKLQPLDVPNFVDFEKWGSSTDGDRRSSE